VAICSTLLLQGFKLLLVSCLPYHVACCLNINNKNVCFLQGVVANGGLLYVIGGDDGSTNLNSVESYDPKSNTWTLLPMVMTTGRSYAGVAVVDKNC